jgi:hypothetical protein
VSDGYEYELVYFGSVKAKLADGWEPAPGMQQVTRILTAGTGHVQTFVWMRRRSGVVE